MPQVTYVVSYIFGKTFFQNVWYDSQWASSWGQCESQCESHWQSSNAVILVFKPIHVIISTIINKKMWEHNLMDLIADPSAFWELFFVS